MRRSPEQSMEYGMRERNAEKYLEQFDGGSEESDLRFLFDQKMEELTAMDIPVDTYGHLDINEFRGRIPEDLERHIDDDMRYVERMEKRFTTQESVAPATARLLERLKTAFFADWFEGAVAVRTSRYDDIANGVDELIIDRETQQPFAAIDTTTNWRQKEEDPLLQEKRRDGAGVKYGFSFDDEGVVQLGSLSNIPLFVVSVEHDDVLEWARRVEHRMSQEEREQHFSAVRSRIREEIVEQADSNATLARNDALRERYTQLGDRFRGM